MFTHFIPLCFCCVEILSKRKMGDRKYFVFSTGGRCQWLMKRWTGFSSSQKLSPYQYPRVRGFSTRLSVYRLSGGSPVTSGRASRTFNAGAVRTWFFCMIDKNDNLLLTWLEKSKLFLLRSGSTMVLSFKSSFLIYVNFGTPPRYLGLYKYTKMCLNLRQNSQNLTKC